jgi:putative endonuclease
MLGSGCDLWPEPVCGAQVMADEKASPPGLLARLKRSILGPGWRWRSAETGRLKPDAVESEVVARAAPLSRREVGARGEELAADYLKRNGYAIVQTNFRCRRGEIDIIARQGECLVFVEVRTRKGAGFGTPEESVTASKRDKLVTLANIYLQSLDCMPSSWRIDVIAVELGRDGKIARFEHIENAIE